MIGLGKNHRQEYQKLDYNHCVLSYLKNITKQLFKLRNNKFESISIIKVTIAANPVQQMTIEAEVYFHDTCTLNSLLIRWDTLEQKIIIKYSSN